MVHQPDCIHRCAVLAQQNADLDQKIASLRLKQEEEYIPRKALLRRDLHNAESNVQKLQNEERCVPTLENIPTFMLEIYLRIVPDVFRVSPPRNLQK